MSATQMLGMKIHRREDPRLITGGGRFIEDVVVPRVLTMAVVRSPHPHARITGLDTSRAMAMPGVVAVLTAADYKPLLSGTHPVAPAFVADKHTVPTRFPLADGEAVFQGEPVAAGLSPNRTAAVYRAPDFTRGYRPARPDHRSQ